MLPDRPRNIIDERVSGAGAEGLPGIRSPFLGRGFLNTIFYKGTQCVPAIEEASCFFLVGDVGEMDESPSCAAAEARPGSGSRHGHPAPHRVC